MTTPCPGRRIACVSIFLGGGLVSAAASHAQCSQTLTGFDTGPGDRLGISVDIDGDTAVIASAYQDGTGIVYTFDLAQGLGLATYSAPGDAGGINSVAVRGKVGLVGTPWEATYTLFHGSAHLYDTPTGQRIADLYASPPTAGDFFGWDVAMDGDYAAVGAPVDPMGGWPGSVFVFQVSTTKELFQLYPSDGSPVNGFGQAVDVKGKRLAIGNPYDDDLGGYSGSVYVFDVTTGQELRKLTASDGSKSATFGWSLAIDGNRLYVGAPYAESGVDRTGAVYVFNMVTGAELSKIVPSDAVNNDGFGTSVSVAGGMLIVGAPGRDDLGFDAGAAYVFDTANAAELFKFLDPGEGAGDLFGMSVAAGVGFALVGCPLSQPTREGFVASLWLSPPLSTNYCGPANLNSTGGSASIAATTCGPVEWNKLQLDAQGMPINKFGYFLVSDTQGFSPFLGGSQGNLCLGGTIGRFARLVQSSGVAGAFGIEVDLQNIPLYQAVTPGQTLNFQAWFRDANPHPTSNYTDGVSVTFF